MGHHARGLSQSNPLKGVAPVGQGQPGLERTPHRALGGGARGPQPAAASRARRRSVPPGAQRTLLGGPHVTPPRPWGSPRRRCPYPHIRRAPRPPPTTANGAPLRAPRDLCARPHPPISARQAAPAAPLATASVRQTPVPPTLPSAPLHPASLPVTAAPATRRVRRPHPPRRLPCPARQARSLHTEPGPATARAYLSAAQLHPNEAPTPHSGEPNSRPRPGVWRQHVAPRRESPRRVGGAVTSQSRAAEVQGAVPAASGPARRSRRRGWG